MRDALVSNVLICLVAVSGALVIGPALAHAESPPEAGETLKMEDQFFIQLCKKNPSAVGCVTKRKWCVENKDKAKGYEAVLCAAVLAQVPAAAPPPPPPKPSATAPSDSKFKQTVNLGGGGATGNNGLTTRTPGNSTPVRRPARKKTKLSTAQLLKIVEIVCPKKPNAKLCRQFRQGCYQNWRTAKPMARQTCRRLGWVPNNANARTSNRRKSSYRGGNTLKGHTNFAAKILRLGKEPLWEGNDGLFMVQGQLGAIDQDGPYALDLDISAGGEVGKGASRLWFEFSVNAGLGLWLSDGFGLAAMVGFAGGGLEEQAPSDWMGTISALAIAEVTDEATLVVRGRAYWAHDEPLRKRGSSTLSFADEFLLQAYIYYGEPTSVRYDSGAYNWVFGAEMREMRDSRMIGLAIGLGHAQR